jgi:long-subunit acyl-CoA synthetase (AMP-forming)
MKAAMPAVSNVVVVGDKRKFLAMLVSLKVIQDKDTGEPTDNLAGDAIFVGQQIGSTAKLYSEAMKDPLWLAYIEDGRKAANKKSTSNAQIVQKWVFLPSEISEKAGELTPTLKLKRNVVNKKYEDIINGMYGSTDLV